MRFGAPRAEAGAGVRALAAGTAGTEIGVITGMAPSWGAGREVVRAALADAGPPGGVAPAPERA
ncbi:MAG TPA: hypothetical protein VE620_05980 [Myxococcales bacterium]|nr:hypothetical protein [Myxococcales bacterium]